VDGEGQEVELGDLTKLPRIELQEILKTHDPILVGQREGEEFIVVAPRGGGLALAEHPGSLATRAQTPDDTKAPTRTGVGGSSGAVRQFPQMDIANDVGTGGTAGLTTELGSAVASPWTSWTRREYNSDLIGLKGLQVYDKMRRSDGTVRGTLRLAKTPVLAAQWGIKPASDSTRDKNVAAFIWNCFQEWMSTSWPQFVTESLLMLDFGYYMFEKVFAFGRDIAGYTGPADRLIWKKLAPRHPMDVQEWYFDSNGGPISVDMWAPQVTRSGDFEGGIIQANQLTVNIPINKLLVFTFDKEAGNIEGVSLLRTAYKHWYYKDNLYKIDAIQKERHGIGVPVIELPMNFSDDDKRNADQLGRNLRTNERAHVVLPPGWKLTFAELKGQPVDCLPSIRHHDEMIPASILGRFTVKEITDVEAQHTLFLKATRFTADIVIDTINKYAIPQLVNYNWTRVGYPKLYAKRIGEQEDWRTESFTLRNYVGAGIIVPDQPLEDQIRAQMGYPEADPETARIVRTPSQANPQRIQPAPSQMPGPGHIVDPAQEPGVPPTPDAPQPTLPRQSKPGVTPPSTGRGDSSGSSGRRGQ
jgi:hypothetical protein